MLFFTQVTLLFLTNATLLFLTNVTLLFLTKATLLFMTNVTLLFSTPVIFNSTYYFYHLCSCRKYTLNLLTDVILLFLTHVTLLFFTQVTLFFLTNATLLFLTRVIFNTPILRTRVLHRATAVATTETAQARRSAAVVGFVVPASVDLQYQVGATSAHWTNLHQLIV